MSRKPPLNQRSKDEQRAFLRKESDQFQRRELRNGRLPDGFIKLDYPTRGKRTKKSGRQKNEDIRIPLIQLRRDVLKAGLIGHLWGMTVVESVQGAEVEQK